MNPAGFQGVAGRYVFADMEGLISLRVGGFIGNFIDKRGNSYSYPPMLSPEASLTGDNYKLYLKYGITNKEV